MSLTILNPNETPPGGWVFRDPDTDFLMKHNNLENLFNMATRHRSANGLTLAQEQFIETVCRNTSGAGCSDGTPPSLIVQAQNLVKEITNWAASGFQNASDAVLEKRRAICEACEFWGGVKGGSLIKGRCKLCGCRGIKLAMATTACPAGKWLPEV